MKTDCLRSVSPTALALAMWPLIASCTPLTITLPFAYEPSAVYLPDGQAVEIPAATDSFGRLVVDVTLNDEGPFTFLVDTGAGAVVVDTAVAHLFPANLVSGSGNFSDALGNIVAFDETLRIDSLTMGTAEFGDVQAFVVDLATGHDGILGFPLFADVLLTLDHDIQVVRLESGSLPDADGQQILPFETIAHQPWLSVAFGEQQRPVLIDSGHNAFLSLSQTDAEVVSFDYDPVPGPLHSGVSGVGRTSIGRLAETLQVGRLTAERPIVFVTGGATKLGTAFLRRFVVTFDQAAGRVRLATEEAKRITWTPIHSKGFACMRDANGIIVDDVLPESPADQLGMRIGDRIAAVNGLVPEELAQDICSQLNTEDSFTLRLARDGAEFDVTLSRYVLVP